jgi:ABC-type Mn2+/Zn2+ transport system permease subunit
MGDALAHAILPGVAVAYLLKGDLLVGALAAAVIVALGIGVFSRHGQMKEDTAIGVVFAAALALGVALMSTIKSYTTDLTHVLFGNVLGVSERDLWLTGGLGILVLVAVLALYKEFLVISFDPVLAATLRLPVGLLRNLLLVLLALTVVVSLQTVGIGLVTAMLVTPGATAYLLTRRLPSMMLIAAIVGAGSAVIGLYLSFYVNVASGAAVVLVCTACFVVTYLFAPERGLVWGALRRREVGAVPG